MRNTEILVMKENTFNPIFCPSIKVGPFKDMNGTSKTLTLIGPTRQYPFCGAKFVTWHFSDQAFFAPAVHKF